MQQVEKAVNETLRDLFRKLGRSLSIAQQLQQGISYHFGIATTDLQLSLADKDGRPGEPKLFAAFSLLAYREPAKTWFLHFNSWGLNITTPLSVTMIDNVKAMVTVFDQSAITTTDQVVAELEPFIKRIGESFAEKFVRLDTVGKLLARMNGDV